MCPEIPAGAVLAWRGKVKDVYDYGDDLLLYFTDRISAFDEVLKDEIPEKGRYLCLTSELLLRKGSRVYPNHIVKRIGDRTLLVVRAKRIDIEFIVRGYLYGSAWRAYSSGRRTISGVRLPGGLKIAEKLPGPILTPTTKSTIGHDMEISKEKAIGSGLITVEEWAELEETSLRLYEFYGELFRNRGLILADIKLEFGRTGDGLMMIDEPPTHDSARIWTEKYYEPGRFQEDHCLDKEFLRAYLRISGGATRLPAQVIEQIAARVRGSYEILVGRRNVDELGLKGLEEVI